MKIISGKKVSFSYQNEKRILNNLSFSINQGDLVGLIGENGVGKSTLFDVLYGVLKGVSGKLITSIDNNCIGYIPQMINLSPTLKMSEYVTIIGCFNGQSKRAASAILYNEWDDLFISRYNKIKNNKVYQCSYGEIRWFIISVMLTLCKNKTFFILDEPTVGIDIQYRTLLWDLIKKLNEKGVTFLISSHLLGEIEKYSDYFYFLTGDDILMYKDMREFIAFYNAIDQDDAFIKATIGKVKC